MTAIVYWPSPLLFCRHGNHARCPVIVAGQHCPCDCGHQAQKEKAK